MDYSLQVLAASRIDFTDKERLYLINKLLSECSNYNRKQILYNLVNHFQVNMIPHVILCYFCDELLPHDNCWMECINEDLFPNEKLRQVFHVCLDCYNKLVERNCDQCTFDTYKTARLCQTHSSIVLKKHL